VEVYLRAFFTSVLERGDPFHTLAATHLIGDWMDTSLGGEKSIFAPIGDRTSYSRSVNIY
jgi:hypothetical protein